MSTPDIIKQSIALIPTMDTDTLSHTWKVYHIKREKQYDSFLRAIESELRKRTKVYKEPTYEDKPDLYPDTDH